MTRRYTKTTETDEELRNQNIKHISVLYSDGGQLRTMQGVIDLLSVIHEEHPSVEEQDMDIYFVVPSESMYHANQHMIVVPVTTERFIQMRKENKIGLF